MATAPFEAWELPYAMKRVRRAPERVPNDDRQMADILSSLSADGLDAVEAACAGTRAEGVRSDDGGPDIPARRREPERPADIDTPDALKPTRESIAGCARYDPSGEKPMERTGVLDAMDRLKLYSMKATYDDILAAAVKRQ